MNIRKTVANCCLLLILCILGGGILIAIANYIPINGHNKSASLEEIAQEGLFPEIPSMGGGYGNFHSLKPTALELATDSLMLKMALYEEDGKGIRQAFLCYSTQYEAEYSRYWHGYVAILRPLLLFFDYYEIRILNGFGQGILVCMAVFYILRQKGKKYALALLTTYILLMPPALAQCLQYSWIFYVCFGALLIYFRHRRYWEQGNRYVYFFMLTGAAAIYVDLLTYPLITWGLPIIWGLLLEEEDRKAVGYLKKTVFSGIAWIAGYGGMWIGKWTLGSVILRKNLFQKAISEAFLWTVDEGDSAITMGDRLYSVFLNWSIYAYKIFFFILAVWLLYWICKGLLSGYRRSAKAPALLLIFSSSLVWYMVMAGHTTMHHIFTHKIFGVSIAAFLGMVLLSTEKPSLCGGTWRKHLFVCSAVFVGTGILALMLMRQLKDNLEIDNGTSGFTKSLMEEFASTTFTPSFSEVNLLYLGFSVENDQNGYCQVQLLDEDKVVDQFRLPFSEEPGSNFHKVSVDWELEAGHPYTLSFQTVGNDGDVYMWITSDGTMPLVELGYMDIDGQQMPGQFLMGIQYWCQLTDLPRKLFFTVTFMGLGIMVFYSVWSVAAPQKTSLRRMPAA